jgi:OOP family OmpA-OmpF porin
VLGGVGTLAVLSGKASLGTDGDMAVHWGTGFLLPTERVDLRFDLRHILSAHEGWTHNPAGHLAFTVGASIPWSVAPAGAPAPDKDKDGVADITDVCPNIPGSEMDGCPGDSDHDSVRDHHDTCPDQAETSDGFQDGDGCPESDKDGDEYLDEIDHCPDVAENYNNYVDTDGCPDEIPREVEKYTGILKGVTFELDSADIKPDGLPFLDEAAAVLVQYADLRLRIIGHTDPSGPSEEYNIGLSRQRADKVRDYLVTKGVDAARIETDGRGSSQPIAPNDTDEGKMLNRRVEFNLIQ